jgi:predicted DNA-binding protein
MSEPAKMKVTNITFYLPIEAKRKLKDFAESQGTSISWMMRNFIDNVLKDYSRDSKKG